MSEEEKWVQRLPRKTWNDPVHEYKPVAPMPPNTLTNADGTPYSAGHDSAIDELKAAIERRGYRVIVRSDIAGIYLLAIASGQRFLSRAVDAVELAHWRSDIGYLAESLLRDMSKGQHHVKCANCKLPLLFEEVYVPGVRLAYGVPLKVVNNDHMEKHYRLVVSGPDAKYHTNCPGCGVLLDGNTKEIDDLKEMSSQ